MTFKDSAPLLGGIEAGGTKFVCAIATSPDAILAEQRIPTTTPGETVGRAIEFFKSHGRGIDAFGIASFGPVQLNPFRPAWGSIVSTPKPGWSDFDLAGAFARSFGCPVAFDTDVNGAALGERRHGAGQGLRDLAYVTVGTGIGGAIIANGELIHGSRHPEIGHIKPRRHPLDQDFTGCCGFHQDCFEGLASGTAIMNRCGAPLHQLPRDHPMWTIEADYLAQLAALLVLTASPQRIIMGGGVMEAEGLLDMIGAPLSAYLGGYPGGIDEDISSGALVVTPGLAGRAGVVGALLLAEAKLRDAA